MLVQHTSTHIICIHDLMIRLCLVCVLCKHKKYCEENEKWNVGKDEDNQFKQAFLT